MRASCSLISLLMTTVLGLLLTVAASEPVFAQAGVIIPGGEQAPNPSKLALDEMSVDIRIHQQFARVKIVQIYGNRTDRDLEGAYVFRLPVTSAISDFAVWDGDTRIPGVILELKRANEIYEAIKRQALDPGLVTQDDEQGGATAFTVQIVPIPAYGTKRVELEYVETLPVEGLRSFFSLPLKPSQYGAQTVGDFRVNLELSSRFPIAGFAQRGAAFPLNVATRDANRMTATFQGNNVSFAEDFAFDYTLNAPRSALTAIAYRAPERISPLELRDPTRIKPDNDGYFEVSALFNERAAPPDDFERASRARRSVVLMLDTSLSMQFEKLDRAYEACETFLRSLTPEDAFSLLLFNDDVSVFANDPSPGTPENVARALDFIRQSYLSGGTDFRLALKRAVEVAKRLPGDERTIVLLTDGNPTLTTTQTGTLVKEFSAANRVGNERVARLYAFGIGGDANQNFLRELARVSRGYFDFGRETDELDFRLNAFFAKVGQKPIEGLSFANAGGDNVYNVYPNIETTTYDGSRAFFVGRYRRPATNVAFAVSGERAGKPIKLETTADLPELDAAHDHLPRVWARQRVDALLRRIALDGEDEALIAEIIALSKKYNFVTPYTAFIAAPRALLRPRVIKPGDPTLRVKTDASITSVVAVFPFGLVKPLTRLAEADVWETRFLAPKDMKDGRYVCRLLLTDASGAVYQEEKGFVIDSRPPQLKARASVALARSGDAVEIIVAADQDARRITARMPGAQPIRIVWDDARKANVGRLRIPAGLPPGSYAVVITAEDFAHNSSSVELTLDVTGG
jgi:Ca-activated chloride channel homolog